MVFCFFIHFFHLSKLLRKFIEFPTLKEKNIKRIVFYKILIDDTDSKLSIIFRNFRVSEESSINKVFSEIGEAISSNLEISLGQKKSSRNEEKISFDLSKNFVVKHIIVIAK